LQQHIRRLCASYSVPQILLLPINHHKTPRHLHFRCPQYISPSHVAGQSLGIWVLLCSST
jgi:hypothetical protein